MNWYCRVHIVVFKTTSSYDTNNITLGQPSTNDYYTTAITLITRIPQKQFSFFNTLLRIYFSKFPINFGSERYITNNTQDRPWRGKLEKYLRFFHKYYRIVLRIPLPFEHNVSPLKRTIYQNYRLMASDIEAFLTQ